MKYIFSLVAILTFASAHAQQERIFVTYDKFIYLIFEEPVVSFDVGSGSVHAESEKNIIKLIPKAEVNNETSLFVTTSSGHYYFIVDLSENPEKFVYNISSSDKDANVLGAQPSEEKSKAAPEKSEEQPGIKIRSALFELTEDDVQLLNSNLEKLHERDDNTFEVGNIGKTISAYLGIVGYDSRFVYISFILENEASIDYHLDFIKFFIETKSSGKKKTEYEEEIVPVAEMIKEKVISKDQQVKYVFAFEKFTINKEKEVRVEFWEEKGDRKTIVSIKSKYILNAEIL